MANKQQISLSSAFVAVIVILLTSQGKAEPEVGSTTTSPVADNLIPELEDEGRTGLESKEDDEFKKKLDSAISDSRLESFLQDMIETTQQVLNKASHVGNSEMVHQCAKEFTNSLENLNKAMDLYRKGVEEDGLKEITTLVIEAAKCYKRCDKAFADASKPSPFSTYDTWLYNLAKKTEKRSKSDVEDA